MFVSSVLLFKKTIYEWICCGSFRFILPQLLYRSLIDHIKSNPTFLILTHCHLFIQFPFPLLFSFHQKILRTQSQIQNLIRFIFNILLLIVCTHLGCVVPWSAANNKFMCPCHGSQYAPDGHVVRGPAPLPLALAHCDTAEDGKIIFSTWTEEDFRTGGKGWWN